MVFNKKASITLYRGLFYAYSIDYLWLAFGFFAKRTTFAARLSERAFLPIWVGKSCITKMCSKLARSLHVNRAIFSVWQMKKQNWPLMKKK